jgi:hypothetical protein
MGFSRCWDRLRGAKILSRYEKQAHNYDWERYLDLDLVQVEIRQGSVPGDKAKQLE